MEEKETTVRHNADDEKFNRDDSTGKGNEAYKSFTKDKRTRTSSSQAVFSTSARREGNETNYEERRRSFNPNFTRDNRPVEGHYNSNREERPQGGFNRERPAFNRDDRPQGGFNRERNFNREERPQGGFNRERNFNREERPQGGFNRDRSFNREERPQGGYNRERNFNRDDRPQGGYNRDRNFNREERPQGERPERDFNRDENYRPRREYGSKPQFNRGGGDKPYRKPFNGDRPSYGAPKPYGQRFDNSPSMRPRRRDEENLQPKSQYTLENYPSYPAPKIETEMRLNRYIAMSGICSRREADDYIQAGVITVNNNVVTELGSKVKEGDEVRFNDKLIENQKKVYIVMNKPKGYVTTLDDPHAEKSVMDLVKNACTERIYPVGRLDKNSIGVLLLTNDGDLAKRLTHPGYNKKKIYQVTLDRELQREDMEKLIRGITLEDGDIAADDISYVEDKKNEVGIEIHSGRNRIVRRMFEAIGYRVGKLDRTYFAGLTKLRLKRGEWRFLSPEEVAMLKSNGYE
ncbi:MAG: pseudouridine synthase [Tidjanibacter sp.]|nr:pseudouridine synthase [Tidjanibacter sp.]